jgi:MFS family permease
MTVIDARKIAVSAFVGTALEWYDFFLFGTAAALVFNRLYFTGEPASATLAAFATFAVGFAARPLGAILFGHLGDRIGRRTCLLLTVTMIGVVTGLIGLLPTYLSIGIIAPIALLLLRLLQGIAVGGEWAGAVTLVVEHVPVARRGRYTAMLQMGSPMGSLLSSGAFLLVALLPPDRFDSWGWRLPFLAAFPLLLVAIYLRRQAHESPLFQQMLATGTRSRSPVREVLVTAWAPLLVGAGTAFLGLGGFYLATTYMISYGTDTLGLPRGLMLAAGLISAAVEIPLLVVVGRLAERYGALRMTIVGGLLSALVVFPMFWLVDSRSTIAVILGVTLGRTILSIPYGVTGMLLAQLFPARLRYSGVALALNAASVASGFVPLLATVLQIAVGGASWTAAVLVVVMAAVSVGSALLVPKLAPAEYEAAEIDDPARLSAS